MQNRTLFSSSGSVHLSWWICVNYFQCKSSCSTNSWNTRLLWSNFIFVMQPWLQQCKIVQIRLLQNTLRFLGLCVYWFECYKCFSLLLLLAVPLIVYINLVEPIIKVTRYCLERHPPQFSLNVVDRSSRSLYPTRTRTLCMETRVCAVIERVYTYPKETTLYNSLTYYLKHKEDGETDERSYSIPGHLQHFRNDKKTEKLSSAASAEATFNRSRLSCTLKLHSCEKSRCIVWPRKFKPQS